MGSNSSKNGYRVTWPSSLLKADEQCLYDPQRRGERAFTPATLRPPPSRYQLVEPRLMGDPRLLQDAGPRESGKSHLESAKRRLSELQRKAGFEIQGTGCRQPDSKLAEEHEGEREGEDLRSSERLLCEMAQQTGRRSVHSLQKAEGVGTAKKLERYEQQKRLSEKALAVVSEDVARPHLDLMPALPLCGGPRSSR